MAKTSLKVSQILAWADACHERTGVWPRSTSGHIPGVPGETWKQVDAALRLGYRGLRGGSSLARLLARQRGVPPYRAPRTPVHRGADPGLGRCLPGQDRPVAHGLLRSG